MDILEISKIASTPKKARDYFEQYIWSNKEHCCIRCGYVKIYQLSNDRYRCAGCRLSFGLFTGRWLGRMNISASQWLWIIKLFELGISARKIAREVNISYPSALRAVHLVRECLVAHSVDKRVILQGEVEADESYFGGKRKGKRGRGAGHKIPVFGILERDGIVKVEVLQDVSAESLLGMTIKTVRRGSIVYTDKFRSYDALMFCGYRHLRVDHQKRFVSGKVYINGLEGFWAFAKERLIKYHGVSKENFPLYLKEMEFRYNNRDKDLFVVLSKLMCHLVPKVL